MGGIGIVVSIEFDPEQLASGSIADVLSRTDLCPGTVVSESAGSGDLYAPAIVRLSWIEADPLTFPRARRVAPLILGLLGLPRRDRTDGDVRVDVHRCRILAVRPVDLVLQVPQDAGVSNIEEALREVENIAHSGAAVDCDQVVGRLTGWGSVALLYGGNEGRIGSDKLLADRC